MEVVKERKVAAFPCGLTYSRTPNVAKRDQTLHTPKQALPQIARRPAGCQVQEQNEFEIGKENQERTEEEEDGGCHGADLARDHTPNYTA
jgi:hypothetical protein